MQHLESVPNNVSRNNTDCKFLLRVLLLSGLEHVASVFVFISRPGRVFIPFISKAKESQFVPGSVSSVCYDTVQNFGQIQ